MCLGADAAIWALNRPDSIQTPADAYALLGIGLLGVGAIACGAMEHYQGRKMVEYSFSLLADTPLENLPPKPNNLLEFRVKS